MNRVVILGGSGFVGRSLCEQFSAPPAPSGLRVLVPSRRRERAKHLFTLPKVDVVQADVHREADLNRVLAGADAVINLVAILHGTPQAFEQAHVTLVQRLVQACVKQGVRRVLHVSALGVPDDPAQAPSNYLTSKAEGELALREAQAAGLLDVTVLRPSVIFGEHDRFLNLFAQLQAVAPFMPLAGAQARFQPVWVEDVARALVACLRDPATAGRTFECAGPHVLTLAGLVRLAGKGSGHARWVLPMPMAVGRLQAAAMAFMPGEPLMSKDNLDSMQVPNVATGTLPGLADLGITPASAEVIAPQYLNRSGDWARRLDFLRSLAGR
jgi:NADH dehydrogenase